jgi:hypothetical protein
MTDPSIADPPSSYSPAPVAKPAAAARPVAARTKLLLEGPVFPTLLRLAPPPITSGLPPTADIRHRGRHFRKVPEPEVAEPFDHLVGAGKDLWRHC